MRPAKTSILAIFLAIAGCGGTSVPNPDAIEAMLNAGDVVNAQKGVLQAVEADARNPRITLLDGRVALELGNYDRAQSRLQGLLTDPTYGAQARIYLAKTHLMAGRPHEAIELLGKPPYTTDLAFAVAGGAQMADGKPEAADALFAQGLAAFPASADLKVAVGERALQEGNGERAAKLAAEAVAAAPKNVQAQLFAARIALANRKTEEAARHFDAVLALRPNFQTALLGKAAIAYDSGDRAGAEKMLNDAAESLGQNALAVGYFRAQLAFDAGKLDEANTILLALTDVNRFPPAVMLSGVVAEQRGQHQQAIALLTRFLGQGGEDPRARIALAQAYIATNDKDAAWKTLQPTADSANASAQVLGLAAKLTGELGLPVSAKYLARQAAAANPGPQGQKLAAADAAIKRGDWAAADKVYGELLAQDPNTTNIILLNNAAMAAMDRRDLPRAITLARRAHSLAPGDPIVLDTLAWALFKSSGPSPEALGMMQKALAAMPGNPEIRQHALAFQNAMQKAR